MKRYDIFLSVIYVLSDNLDQLHKILKNTIQVISPIVADYEIIIVDNVSDKNKSVPLLKKLTNDKELHNLQVYVLNKKVEENIASCIGLDKSLGDFVAVLNPLLDDISFLPKMEQGAYRQMPYEEITSKEYEKMVSELKYLSFRQVKGNEAIVDKFCNNDTCEIDLGDTVKKIEVESV